MKRPRLVAGQFRRRSFRRPAAICRARSARRLSASKAPATSAEATLPDTISLARDAGSARRKSVPQPPDQDVSALVLHRPQRRRVPLGPIHVVDRNEGRFAAHRQSHVVLVEVRVHLMTERLNLLPLLSVVRLGDSRIFMDASDRHRELESRAGIALLRFHPDPLPM